MKAARERASFLLFLLLMMCGLASAHAFVHPGCLSTQADLDRMKAKVDAGAQPWKAGFDRLVAAPYGQLGHTPSPQPVLYASGSQPDNYITLARDVAAAYQCALRYHVTGDPAYAAKAVDILMLWANTHTGWNGNTNVSLRAGLYGYQLACAGELVRNYSGWAPADFTTFKNYVRNQFYKIVSPNAVDRGFLFHHHGTCWSHYWANWDLAAMATVIATGVLCDDEAIFQEGIDYFYNGVGVGRISELLHYLHPNGLGQPQEFGRDQGHATMLVPLLGTFCEIAWNQGVDLYSELDNAFLAMSENLAKYNLWCDTPYVPYINCEYIVQTNIGTPARGHIRAGVDLVYNHYVNRMGMSAPYTQQAAAAIRPEGGGGQNGTDSGGFDQLGFTTLTHSLDPIASGALPAQLRAHVKGGKITLSWRGSAYAKSYNVKRATTPGGPYINLAKVGPKNTTYIDMGVPAGTTCYYVVSANNLDGESAPSPEISATHDRQLYGTVIGTDGSAGNWGATKWLAFDGSLKNFMDAWAPDGGWAGLDLGAGVSAVITGVKYCPQPGGGHRLVGGVVEAANSPDFSDAVNLFTVTSAPPSGVFTTQSITNANAFRYVRFRALPNNYCTLAEVQFIGNVTGGMTPPAHAPAGLAVSSPWPNEATLTWSSVPGATDYVLKRASAPGGPYTVIDYNPPWDMDYTERRLAAGTYYYVVSALNSIGETTDSNEVSITISASNTPAMITHLAFDETSGTVASDSSGNGGNGTLVNEPTWTAGILNNAVNLDGVDDHVELPGGFLNGAESCTVAAWVRPDTLSTWARIFDFGTGTTSYMFLAPTTGKPRFAIKINNSVEQIIDAPDALAVGEWTHLAVTLSGSTGTLYVNGVAVATNSAMTFKPSYMGNTMQNYLGKSQWNDPYLNGSLDDFRIYSTALNASEIGILATGQLAVPQNVVATPGASRITLSWSAVAGATDYTIQRSSNIDGPFTDLATGVATTYVNTGLADGATWYYTVTATGLPGASPPSSPVSATTCTTLESWRLIHFGSPASSGNADDSADPDGDGWNNAKEFAAGTDPNDRTSLLKVSQMQAGGNDMRLNFSTVNGKVYRVERSDSLLEDSWTTVVNDIAGTGSEIQVTDPEGATGPRRFYRIVVRP